MRNNSDIDAGHNDLCLIRYDWRSPYDAPRQPDILSADGFELLKAKVRVNINRLSVKDKHEVDNEYKMPMLFYTPHGDRLLVTKYNLSDNILYAEVNGKEMSTAVTSHDVWKYKEHIASPREVIVKNFGDKLSLKEYYEQFAIPRLIHINPKSITIQKNPDNNVYELKWIQGNGYEIGCILNDYDAKSFFDKNATKEQLVAKCLYNLQGKYSPSQTMEPEQAYGKQKGRNYNEESKQINQDNPQTINNKTNMAKKKSVDSPTPKAEEVKTVNVKSESVKSETAKQETVKTEAAKPEKRAPQMVTANGEKVTHGHVYKSNASDDWFFTAKIDGVPLKPQKVSQEDMEGMINKTKNIEEMMQKYYPTKLMPKVSAEDMKLPVSIMTPAGEQRLYKFNAYKVHEMDNVDYGKYRFYAQVDDMKMSATASRQDLNAYFDKVMKPADMVAKVFGERLNMPEHYKQFQLPEGANIEAKDIRIMKNQQTNKYEISANLGAQGKTPAKEMSYDDRQSYFTYKTASKEQLAAKYLGNEISAAMKTAPKHEQSKQMALGI